MILITLLFSFIVCAYYPPSKHRIPAEMATGPIESAVADAERVAKKQKTCAASTSKGLESLLQVLQTAKELLDKSPGDPPPSFLHDLYTQLNDAKVVSTITNDTKDLHSAVSKLGKV